MGSAATARGSLALSPRSPKHTIQVSDMDRRIQARIVSRRSEERHEEQLAIEREEEKEDKGEGREEEEEVRECGEREREQPF